MVSSLPEHSCLAFFVVFTSEAMPFGLEKWPITRIDPIDDIFPDGNAIRDNAWQIRTFVNSED